MQNTRVMESWRFPPRFQRKAQEGRQCVAELDSLQGDPEKVTCKVVRKKLIVEKLGRDARNVECLQGMPQAVSKASPRELPCDL
jgi:hypothetical protein